MLRVLLTAGVKPDFVVGASVGAINASYFAGAPDAAGVATLERIWSGLRRADIFPFTQASAIGLIRPSAKAATVRTGPGQWFAEFVATFGLLLTIFGCGARTPTAIPYAVGLYITAAYWFHGFDIVR
jgi:predicted acylesterase/phospholipase RssA